MRAVAVQADVSAEDDVRRLLDTVCDQLGVPTGLVNNAGIVAPRGRLADFTTERIARVVSVNLVGTILCTREAVRRMSVRHGGNGGAIVNVSSRAAVRGSPNEYVDYAAAKAGVDALTVGLARELADDGIRVNAVRPALIDTEIHEPGRLAQLGHAVPLGRPGRAGKSPRRFCGCCRTKRASPPGHSSTSPGVGDGPTASKPRRRRDDRARRRLAARRRQGRPRRRQDDQQQAPPPVRGPRSFSRLMPISSPLLGYPARPIPCVYRSRSPGFRRPRRVRIGRRAPMTALRSAGRIAGRLPRLRTAAARRPAAPAWPA